MKNKILSMAIMLSIIVFISSCSKVEEMQPINSANNKMVSARINTNMSNEEMETDIKAFIDKLENPSSYGEMNFEEAFEYIEATLNYKYVNYDYSKCANTKEFTGNIQIAIDSNENMQMQMNDITDAYEQILADWRVKYHSISETVKTPIVFDITDVTPTGVKYTMIVGYGSLDLYKWGEEFVPSSTTYFFDAVYEYNNRLYNHLNNNMIQWCPSGNRVYIPQVGLMQYLSYSGLPSGGADPLPPNNNNYCDYRLYYSHASLPNHHLYFNTQEYSFYNDQGYLLMTNYLNNNPNANYISQAYFYPQSLSSGSNVYMAMHQFSFYYGFSYITASNVYTL